MFTTSIKQLAGAFVLSAAAVLGTSQAFAATVKLGFALDDSGSMSVSEYNLQKQGLANALSLLPTNGTYEIAVVKFNSTAQTILAPTVVTASNLGTIQTTITGAARNGGSTCIGCGINLLVDLFGDIGSDLGLINVSTDGGNNVGNPNTAVTNAQNNGFDSLSFEAVGVTSTSTLNSLASLAFPGTVQVYNSGDALPNPLTESFVIRVTDFAGYEAAIRSKLQRIVDVTDPNTPDPIPLPAGAWLMIGGLGALAAVRRRRKTA